MGVRATNGFSEIDELFKAVYSTHYGLEPMVYNLMLEWLMLNETALAYVLDNGMEYHIKSVRTTRIDVRIYNPSDIRDTEIMTVQYTPETLRIFKIISCANLTQDIEAWLEMEKYKMMGGSISFEEPSYIKVFRRCKPVPFIYETLLR